MPRIVPVIDVMNGQVVHAVSGRRDDYRLIKSRLTDSTEPATVAKAMLQATGGYDLYVADLDAIRGDGITTPAVDELISRTTEPRIWLDCGTRDLDSTRKLHLYRNVRLILSLESLPPKLLQGRLGWHRNHVAFSIELRNGRLIDSWRHWNLEHDRDVLGIQRQLFEAVIGNIFIIDLATVGVEAGLQTMEACRPVLDLNMGYRIYTGGGVRTWADAQAATDSGIYGVLTASAIHQGKLQIPNVSATRR